VAFLRRASAALSELSHAERDAWAAHAGRGGRLVVAYSGAVTTTPIMAAVALVARRAPKASIEVQRRSLPDQLDALARGDVDLGSSFMPTPPERQDLMVRLMKPMALMAWVHDTHPLAGRRTLSWSRLAQTRWVVLSERAETGFASWLEAHRLRASTALEVDALDAALELVRRGVATAILPDTPIVPAGVVRIPIRPAPRVDARALWSTPVQNPLTVLALEALGLA